MPASVPSSAMIVVCARAGARPSGRMPTRRRGGAVVELVAHHQAAGEIPVHLAALADDPGQAGLDRAGEFVEVVAVEAEPGFQPQRIAGAKADGDDLGLGDQRVRQGFGLCRPAREISKPSSPV